jgi:hypothetical protein
VDREVIGGWRNLFSFTLVHQILYNPIGTSRHDRAVPMTVRIYNA